MFYLFSTNSAWEGSGEAATDEQVAAIPPVLGVETTSGFIEGSEKETTYYPSPTETTQTGSTASSGGTVDNTASGTTDGSGTGTTGATSGPTEGGSTEGGGSTEAQGGTNTDATQGTEQGPTTTAPPEEETTTGTTTTVTTTTTTTTTVETTTTEAPDTTTQTEGTPATYIEGGQVGGGGFNIIDGASLTKSPSASPTTMQPTQSPVIPERE